MVRDFPANQVAKNMRIEDLIGYNKCSQLTKSAGNATVVIATPPFASTHRIPTQLMVDYTRDLTLQAHCLSR
jgi:hypothetical protein